MLTTKIFIICCKYTFIFFTIFVGNLTDYE